jgi:hypothetical protein
MAKKVIESATRVQSHVDPMFVTWDSKDPKSKALALYGNHEVATSHGVVRSAASNVYQNIAPKNVSVRDGFDRCDYNMFRPGEGNAHTARGIMIQCNRAYKTVGLVRTIVDMMTDLVCDGISVTHPNENIERFYKEWWKRVRGFERSDRFVSYALRMGTAVVQRRTAKISVPVEEDMKRSQGEADIKIDDKTKFAKREIPWKYDFLHPANLKIENLDLALFSGVDSFVFSVKIPANVAGMIRSPKGAAQQAIVDNMPQNIKDAVKNGDSSVVLDPKKTKAYYYKRDDWEPWADSIIFPVLDDIKGLQKMKLADMAALDGAISCIRVWKIGSLEKEIWPTPAAINALAEQLMNNVGGGVMDLVYNPGIELEETSTEVSKFLGEAKYQPTLVAITTGMGAPVEMSGGTVKDAAENSSITIKGLVKRLEYIRSLLYEFWEEELRLVQQGMGFRFPAKLTFNVMNFAEEAAEKKLLLDLADRDYISVETLQERFGLIPEIEEARIRKEHRRRESNMAPPKASPFHSPQTDHEMKKIYAQHGTSTPTEMGLSLNEKKPGESSPAEISAKLAPKKETPTVRKGQPGQGRPKNSKDSSKRKTRVAKSQSVAFLQNVARYQKLQAQVSQVATPIYLKALNKKNQRELTVAEASKLEQFKFYALANINPEIGEVTEETLKTITASELKIPFGVDELVRVTIAKHTEQFGHEPGVDTVRGFQVGAIAMWNFEDAD